MRGIVLTIALVCICTSLISCGNKKSTEVVTSDNGRRITKTDSQVKEVSGSDYVSKKVIKENYYNNDVVILEDRVITASHSKGLDIIYNDGKKDYIEPQNKGFYIVNYMSNGKYIIWVEANVDVRESGKRLEKEYIYSRNIETGEFIKVATFDYTGLESYQAGVRDLDVSKNNNLVYKYYQTNDSGAVKEKAILYNLEKNFQKEISSNTDESIKIENLNVGLENVIYTQNSYNLGEEKVLEQKVLNYKIDDGTIEELNLGIEVKKLDIYDRDIAFISESQNENLELYIYNIDNSQLISRVFEDSNLIKYYEKIGVKLDYNKGSLNIDDTYIYMLGQSSVVYNLKNKKFIVLENDMITNNYDHMYSKKVGNKKVIVSCNKGNEKITTEYILK
ncbi:MAG: hypothetical protein ACRDCW_05675 [Sarcina sp.]